MMAQREIMKKQLANVLIDFQSKVRKETGQDVNVRDLGIRPDEGVLRMQISKDKGSFEQNVKDAKKAKAIGNKNDLDALEDF